MGISQTAKSVVMLKMAYPMPNFLKSKHDPLRVQKALTGVQLKMLMNVEVIPHMATSRAIVCTTR